jgi:hypothetical protein
MNTKIHLLFFYLISLISNSQNYPLSDQSKISIITCDKGDELHSLFGHTGIRIQDPARDIDTVFNFGMFDFSTPNFYLKFVKGDLQYYVDQSPFEHFIYAYRLENRSIYEQELSLSLEQKQQLFDHLNKSLYSENKFYTYKFIDKNCTTMVVDQLNAIYKKNIIQKTDEKKSSYRKVLNPYIDNLYFEKLGINIIFGYRTDEAAEQLFLPIELFNSLHNTTFQGKKLVNKEITHFTRDSSLKTQSWWNKSILIYFILALLLLLRNKWFFYIYLTIAGLLGIFLLTVGIYSEHREVLLNYNVLLFNPFLLFLIYFYQKKNKKWLEITEKILVFCLFAYLFFMINKAHLSLMAPFIIIHILIFIFFHRRFRKLLTTKKKYST